MRIEQISVDEIVPSSDNPRQDLQPTDPEYQALWRSIGRWDLVEPLVWNVRTKRLVSGHQRLKVLKDQGVSTVDVSVVDLDETEEQALGIALNKISGNWDDPKLFETLARLEMTGLDVTLTGFDAEAMARLAQDFKEAPMFEPVMPAARVDAHTVRPVDVTAAEHYQETRFAGTIQRKVRPVTCPQCGHEFGLLGG